jgi:chaperonin cofactor prefoldin
LLGGVFFCPLFGNAAGMMTDEVRERIEAMTARIAELERALDALERHNKELREALAALLEPDKPVSGVPETDLEHF